jgi:hypothetical protein
MIGEVGSISVVVLGALGNAVVWACVKVFDMGRTSFDCYAFSIMEVRRECCDIFLLKGVFLVYDAKDSLFSDPREQVAIKKESQEPPQPSNILNPDLLRECYTPN